MISRQLADVAAERACQDKKWGVQRHNFAVWLVVLMEEVGEVAEATLRYRSVDEAELPSVLEDMRLEAIQTAAVAVALVEHIDEELASRRS